MGKNGHIKLRNRNIFVRFFLSVMLVSTVSAVLLASFLFYWFQGKVLDDLERIRKSELLITGTAYEGYVEMARHFTMALYKNPHMKSVILSNNQEWNSSYSYAVYQVQSILSVNQFINSIYMVSPDGIVFFVANNTETPQSGERLFQYIQRQPDVSRPIVWEMQSLGGEALPTLTVFFRETISQDGVFNGAIAVNINRDSLREAIFSDQMDPTQEIMVLDREGRRIIQSSITGQELPERDYTGRILSGEAPEGAFRLEIDGRDTLVTFVAMNGGEFYVVSEAGYQSGISQLTSGRNLLFLVCGCIMISIALASAGVSYLAYRPIGTVFNNMRLLFHIPEPRGKGEDEARIMTSTLTQIAQRMNSLEKQHTNAAVTALLQGREQESSGELLVKAGVLPGTQAPYRVAVLRIDRFDAFSVGNSPEARSFQITSLCTLAAQCFAPQAMCSAYQTGEDTVALIITGKKPLGQEEATAVLAEAQRLIKKSLGLEITIGLSPQAAGPGQLGSLYQEAYLLTKAKILYGSGNLFQSGDQAPQAEAGNLNRELENVLQAVKAGTPGEFRCRLDEYMMSCREYGYDQGIAALSRLAVAIKKLGNQVASRPADHIDYPAIHEDLLGFTDYEQALEWFLALYAQVHDGVNQANSRTGHGAVTDAIAYITANYADTQLSVNSMAERLSLSTGYFSRVFNEATGCSFPDYVNNLRLEKARELLENGGGENIRGIAAQVGYSSDSYFSSSFKKRYGVSPSKWRMRHQK